jgi:hypothetical protein
LAFPDRALIAPQYCCEKTTPVEKIFKYGDKRPELIQAKARFGQSEMLKNELAPGCFNSEVAKWRSGDLAVAFLDQAGTGRPQP